MPIDLIKVQAACKEAHSNFLIAMELDRITFDKPFVEYTNGFLDPATHHTKIVRESAEKCKKMVLGFDKSFNITIEKVAFLRIEQDLLVTSATNASISIMLQGFNKYLDQIAKNIASRERSLRETDIQIYDEASVEALKVDAERLGYATALVEQLGSNLIAQRVQWTENFFENKLKVRTPVEVLKHIERTDIVDLIKECLVAYSDYLVFTGIIKKALDIFAKKRNPRAGHELGDTDILFEFHEMLDRDVILANEISNAITEAKRCAEALRVREAEAGVL